MGEARTLAEIDSWVEALVSAHGGGISKKRIRGKDRYYLQWRENGSYKRVYLKTSEVDAVCRQLARRKELSALLKTGTTRVWCRIRSSPRRTIARCRASPRASWMSSADGCLRTSC